MWPTVINTAVGVRSISPEYLNVGRVLRLSTAKMLRKIIIPATLPYLFTGYRLSLGIAWLVIVASEMLTGAPGVGGFLWQEYNSLVYSHIILAILTIGLVGFVLDRADERRRGADADAYERVRCSSFAASPRASAASPQPVLADLDLVVEEGEFAVVVGCSGSGKTTLISLAAGLLAPDRGEVLLRRRARRRPRSGARRRLPELLAPAVADRARQRAPRGRSGVARALEAATRSTRRSASSSSSASARRRRSGRASSPAACASASRSRARSRWSRACSSSTSRSPRSTRSRAARSRRSSRAIWRRHGRPSCSSRTTSTRRSCSPTASIRSSSGPAASLGRSIEIEIPRPRVKTKLSLIPEYQRARREIIDVLSTSPRWGEVARSAGEGETAMSRDASASLALRAVSPRWGATRVRS